jgi:hypothetical protein
MSPAKKSRPSKSKPGKAKKRVNISAASAIEAIPAPAVETTPPPEAVLKDPSKWTVIFIRMVLIAMVAWVFFRALQVMGFIPNTTNVKIPPPPAKLMDVVLEFDGIKSKWGYCGWSTDRTVNPQVNVAINKKPMNINNHTYTRGIGTHAISEIVFDLQGKVKRFSCTIGINIDAGADGSAIFVVSADKKKLYTSPLMTTRHDPIPIDLDVTGAKELSLFVDPAGQNNWDQANWADIKFTYAPGMEPAAAPTPEAEKTSPSN